MSTFHKPCHLAHGFMSSTYEALKVKHVGGMKAHHQMTTKLILPLTFSFSAQGAIGKIYGRITTHVVEIP